MTPDIAFAHLKTAYTNEKLAGSWLISGVQIAESEALIRRFAGFLLTNKEEELSFHADLKWIEKDYTDEEKKDIVKTLEAGKELGDTTGRARKSEITVDDIRLGIQFLSLTASGDKWRILVIDSADDMNSNAANALLKLLEEPPQQAVIFLISQNIGRLLPTIRSRCRKLALSPPSDEAEMTPFYQEMEALLMAQPMDTSAIFAFCDKAAKDDALYQMTQAALSTFILHRTKQLLHCKEKLDLCMKIWDDVHLLLKSIDALYLDKKAALATLLIRAGELK